MAQLRQHTSDLKTNVVIISFGSPYSAQLWKLETLSQFTLLLDPEQNAYRAYGLERSMLRSWGLNTFLTYSRLLLNGRKWRGIQGDSSQLGGDFIVNTNGIIRLAYYSRDPSDRPSVSYLQDILHSTTSHFKLDDWKS
ncbi:AhpC/TSA family protein [Chloroflexota bacterium]